MRLRRIPSLRCSVQDLNKPLLEPCPTLPFANTPPLPEQQEVLFPSNFGILVLLSRGRVGGGGGVGSRSVRFVSHPNLRHLSFPLLCEVIGLRTGAIIQ